MKFGCATLLLTPPWRDERLILVRATDAIRLCRDGGYENLSSQQAAAHLGNLGGRAMAQVREFVVQARLSGFRLSELDDGDLLAQLRHSIASKDVVALRACEGDSGEGSSTVVERRLVREIDSKTKRRLSYSGRQYRLVAGDDLQKLPDRDNYEVVRHDEATKVLSALADQIGNAQGDVPPLLARARDELTPDWRPSQRPDGLVLLRRIASIQAQSPDAGPALTPSQIKQLSTKNEWIEIQVTDDLGKPYTGLHRIELPDGGIDEGNFDAEGLWGNYDIKPGKCKLLYPDVPESVKPAPAPPPGEVTTWISVKLVDDEGEPVVGRSYTLKLADGSEREGVSDDDEVRVDDIVPGTCVYTLKPDAAGAE
jgi:hypothetical protein